MASGEQARLESIVETAVDGIITIDESGLTESFNPAAERMFGYSADEVIGQNVSILLPAPYRNEHNGYLRRYLVTGEKRIVGSGREVTGRRKDGSTFPMRLSVGEFWLGDQRRFTGIVHDLTEQKQAEQRALQAERLAAIGQMVTVLTHEGRNSLQLSQANLDMLCLEIEDRPEALDCASRIQTAQDRLQRLFEQLREFAAPICLDREPYNLRSLVGQVFNELSAVHTDKQICLREQANGTDLHCAVDAFRMHQVFRNILENSIAASPNPVQISIAWTSSELNGAPALQVVLRDNGPGLSAEHKEKVFEPFFTTKKRGTGLGLVIARRIVEAHDGQIAAGGNGSGGAEFVIKVPRESSFI
jgi:PAS domain S-box-containing protein